ncbi:peptidase M48 [Neosynechococcus sphagnicola sy1]|uniref:Peptidase M48 n=1 Tax=Neosynechococcus sphagnicola sy1 TaxID=1497020 RepID=A0A098TLA9_9CYAN|nr:M48 family metallopeptidase [Neosynechococcus sphagnicola]KGF73090.1 peptidase M48 [Neosynechococcus sphagnicola sy1]
MPTYPGISSDAFRHPLDQQAEAALRSVPGFDLVARKFVEFVYERPQLVYLMGNSVQVGPRQYSSLYQLFRECVRDLDLTPEPSLFVVQNQQANSYAIGQEQPCIVLNSGLLDLLAAPELRAVLAHELGHIKCGHTTLIQMATWIMGAASFVSEITLGLGNLVTSGLILAFYEWRRKAELSSDRAALLVTDDLETVLRSLMQVAGGSLQYAHECSLEAFIQQSERYQALDQNGLNQVYKFLLYSDLHNDMLSHPFPVERIQYLQAWAASSAYAQIRQGHYQRVSDTGAVETTATETAATTHEAEILRRQIQDLQSEIDRIKSPKSP